MTCAFTLVGLLMLTAACGQSSPAANPIPTPGPTKPSTTATPSRTPPPSASVGSTVKIPEWTVKLTAVRADATQEIIRASGGFVTTPQHQYALITYEATYTGAHRSADVLTDLRWQLTPRRGGAIPAAGASPPAVYTHWPTTARRGSTVRFQIVFDVTTDQYVGAVLSVGRVGSSFATVHGDFLL